MEMDLPTSAEVIDHLAHAIFDLAIPALLAWVLSWARRQWGTLLVDRIIRQAAGVSYLAMRKPGANLDNAISEAAAWVQGQKIDLDRATIAQRVRAELGALLANQEPKP